MHTSIFKPKKLTFLIKISVYAEQLLLFCPMQDGISITLKIE